MWVFSKKEDDKKRKTRESEAAVAAIGKHCTIHCAYEAA
jgi:hypothetical protein